jgi:hypothetical protein
LCCFRPEDSLVSVCYFTLLLFVILNFDFLRRRAAARF